MTGAHRQQQVAACVGVSVQRRSKRLPPKLLWTSFCVLMVMGNRVVCCALSSFEAVSLVRI